MATKDPDDRPEEHERAYAVGELAKLARVSVRTLHHYDEIGLLCPSGRTKASYRRYTSADAATLQQILFFRELGMPLERIKRILDEPAFDRTQALLTQRALLIEKAERLAGMILAIDETLTALEGGATMKDEDLFGDFDPEVYEDEAKRRWGDTPAYAEAAKRTKRYTKDDWTAIRAEARAIMEDFAAALDAGAAPSDSDVRAIAERARRHIDRYFYPCSREMHAALGQMYTQDPRFSATYESVRPGLAQFVCDAIAANV